MYTCKSTVKWLSTMVALLALALAIISIASCAQPFAPPLESVDATQRFVVRPDFVGRQAVSVDEAQSRVSFDVWVPDAIPQGYTLEWIGTNDPSEAQDIEFVNLVYSDGQHRLFIGQGRYVRAAVTAQLPTAAEMAERNLQAITVRGYPGIGVERGTIESQSHGTLQQDALVQWWASDVKRSVWSRNLFLADLQSVAEAME